MKTVLVLIAIGGLTVISIFSFVYIDMNTINYSHEELTYEEFFRLHVSETCPITEKPENASSYDPVHCNWVASSLEEERRRIQAGGGGKGASPFDNSHFDERDLIKIP